MSDNEARDTSDIDPRDALTTLSNLVSDAHEAQVSLEALKVCRKSLNEIKGIIKGMELALEKAGYW